MKMHANHNLDVRFEEARAWRRERALRTLGSAGAKADVLGKHRRQVTALADALLAKDVDLQRLNAIQTEMRADLQRAADEAKAKAGADHHGEMKAYVERLRIALEDLTSFTLPLDAPPSAPYYILLNTPQSIYTTSGLNAVTNVAPLNSTARFSFKSNASSGYEEVVFSFVWQNPYDVVVVLNVDAYPIFRGYCEADADSGIFSSGKSNLTLYTQLELQGASGAGLPPGSSDAYEQVASLHADGGSFFSGDGVGAIEWTDVYRGYDLRAAQAVVQARDTLGIDLVASMVYSTTGGDSNAQFEFSTNNRAITAYAVLLTIVS